MRATSKQLTKNQRHLVTKVQELKAEFEKVKAELFGGSMFVAITPENQATEKRYQQLLGFFLPQFRDENWRNPLEADGIFASVGIYTGLTEEKPKRKGR